ncbi:hypothetical protein RIR_jg7637.t1 [Rhizophagus irregularis DAOM 181602=DAOM 197198]|nr:hypothetical protein RIR_jg7637.t1 [Rhizophagus irregularis DAOM 181602=DAOM 197198]
MSHKVIRLFAQEKDKNRVGHPISVREGTGISVVGLHHGELVCTVRPHISTKGHGVLLTFPMRPLVLDQPRCSCTEQVAWLWGLIPHFLGPGW